VHVDLQLRSVVSGILELGEFAALSEVRNRRAGGRCADDEATVSTSARSSDQYVAVAGEHSVTVQRRCEDDESLPTTEAEKCLRGTHAGGQLGTAGPRQCALRDLQSGRILRVRATRAR